MIIHVVSDDAQLLRISSLIKKRNEAEFYDESASTVIITCLRTDENPKSRELM